MKRREKKSATLAERRAVTRHSQKPIHTYRQTHNKKLLSLSIKYKKKKKI